jgi:HPt (histidine-containing phosphotransfer) domain-containing protein
MSEESKRYVDVDTALGRVGGKTAIYKRLLNLFLQSKEFAELETRLAENDYAKAAEVAHGIKGMTGNLGLTLLFDSSAKLMAELQKGVLDENSLTDYRSALNETIPCVQALLETLE